MKTKVVQHVPKIIFNVFKVFRFSGDPGSYELPVGDVTGLSVTGLSVISCFVQRLF